MANLGYSVGGGAGLTPAGNTKQDKIFTYTVANLTDLNAITGMVAGNTAITLDTLKEYIYTTQWEQVSIDATQLEKPILNFSPRVFYSFYKKKDAI